MKKISEHLGQIIIALAGVALLIAACVVFKEPIGEFYNSIVGKEVSVAGDVLAGVEDPNLSDLSSSQVVMLEGAGQVFFTALPEALSFRSSAPINEFQEVQVNGETVDPSNYTVTEGSTIITFNEDYLASLSAEGHEVKVVSNSGAPTASFSVVDGITRTEGDYIYTIMQDGFETLEKARAYYKVYSENMSGQTWEEVVDSFSSEEAAWTFLSEKLGVGLTESTFVPVENASKYWAAAVIDRTKTAYEPMESELLGIPVTDITNAFEKCKNLQESPTLSTNITRFYFTFYGCSSLTTITIPNGITSIGDSAFRNCTSLTSVTIPDSGTSIGDSAFLGTSLTSVTIPDSITSLISIGESAFSNCDSLTSVTIGNGVTSIDTHAFRSCDSLSSVTIGDSVTRIADSAFSDCKSLTYNILDTGKYLGNTANPYLVLVETTSDDITDFAVPETTKIIASRAFSNCTNLASVTIPDSVTTISYDAFYKCSNLTSVTIPNSVTSIEDYAFSDCDSLSSVTIGNGVTSINRGTFMGTGLTSVTIPDSVTSIGVDAFSLCQSLTTINYAGTVEQWNTITLGNQWNEAVPATEVSCSDGTVSLS